MKFVPKRLEKTADISRGDTSWQSFLKSAVSVVVILALAYLALGALGELTARMIPDSWEVRLFLREQDVASDNDAESLARAETILRRMVAGGELRDLPYRLRLVSSPEANAFAFPGGDIGVTQELLDSVESDSGLALVLGHELGHHQARHPLRRMGRKLVLDVARSLLFGRNGNPIVDATLSLADSGYSRRQERSADAFGLRRVHETYGRSEECLEFFEDLQQSGGAEARWAAFFRSHPLTANRLEELRRLQETLRDGN